MARSALVASAALALTVGTAASAASAQAASHNVRRACAVTHTPGVASCMALIRTDITQKLEAAFGGKVPVGFGYGPSDLTTAYNLPPSSTVLNVAVVDAFNDPNAVSDVATYRSSWGLPACDTSTGAGCLTVTNQHGQASPLPANSGSSGWATEESLDVDMVSAICPNCHIYLVESNQPTTGSLGVAVDNAVKVIGAQYVS